MRIPSPQEIQAQCPLSSASLDFIAEKKKEAKKILNQEIHSIAVLVGPCSIHDPDLALAYAEKLKNLSQKTKNLRLIMRVFLEKPRTYNGWKGLIYDPRLDGSYDFHLGLKLARKLLVDIASIGVPSATEILDPLVSPYFSDLISWGMIGARTTASQPHRHIASGMDFPIGFKNGVQGDLEGAIYGILSAQDPHTYLSINAKGELIAKQTAGNPFTHLVLRGSDKQPNFDRNSIQEALLQLENHHLPKRVMIDCSHGNSQKNHTRQAEAFRSVMKQIQEGEKRIIGVMLESHLKAGKQALQPHLAYGISITDACIGWEETEELLLEADSLFRNRSTETTSTIGILPAS